MRAHSRWPQDLLWTGRHVTRDALRTIRAIPIVPNIALPYHCQYGFSGIYLIYIYNNIHK